MAPERLNYCTVLWRIQLIKEQQKLGKEVKLPFYPVQSADISLWAVASSDTDPSSQTSCQSKKNAVFLKAVEGKSDNCHFQWTGQHNQVLQCLEWSRGRFPDEEPEGSIWNNTEKRLVDLEVHQKTITRCSLSCLLKNKTVTGSNVPKLRAQMFYIVDTLFTRSTVFKGFFPNRVKCSEIMYKTWHTVKWAHVQTLLPGLDSPGGWEVCAYRSRDWNAWNPVWYFHHRHLCHKHFHCITHWPEGNLAIKDKITKNKRGTLLISSLCPF